MSLSLWVTNISQLLALCGLTSIRMFLPTFLYFLVLRLSALYPDFFPEIIRRTGGQVPPWQVSTPFLVLLGLLAAAEIAAVRCPELKKFLTEDFDKFAKPLLTVLVVAGILSAQQQESAQSILGVAETASVFSFHMLWALPGGWLTWLACRARERFYDIVNSLDPGGELGLQRFLSASEEFLLLVLFLILIFVPLIALFIVLGQIVFSFAVRKAFAMLEQKHSHFCPECGKKGVQTRVSNCAVICPVCGSGQTSVCQVGFLGFSSSKRVPDGGLEKHVFELQKVRRCRCCASPLEKRMTCEVCGNRQWTPESAAFFRLQMRKRAIVFGILAVLSLFYPLIAFFVFLFTFNVLLIRPYRLYLDFSQGFLTRFLFTLAKVLLVVPMILLASVPLIGILALLPFILRYVMVRRQFESNIAACMKGAS